ncbi:hypothetical protein [Pontiella agarivorans]|uniref:Uncharacterized protein n=1 Tax=Pontiella agarivorans TaxID=3038953 RepID=A0ABU5MYQ7_9BACT|nr:hypothetical protein [Pontiella agarivorans]MDZ8119111.1 hypothetical protein [Pontiella agarivorans]
MAISSVYPHLVMKHAEGSVEPVLCFMDIHSLAAPFMRDGSKKDSDREPAFMNSFVQVQPGAISVGSFDKKERNMENAENDKM